MAVTPEQRAALQKLGRRDLRQQLDHAGPGLGAIVPGLGDGMISRCDVQSYLRELEEKEAAQLLQIQERTLWWAKAAAWLSVASIVASIAIAWVQSR